MTELEIELVQLGEIIREVLTRALVALNDRDGTVVDWVLARNRFIQRAHLRITSACTALLANGTITPAERRRLVAIMQAVADFERINDHTLRIARWVQEIAAHPDVSPPGRFWDLARATLYLLVRCLVALKQSALEPLYRLQEEEADFQDLWAGLWGEFHQRWRENSDYARLDPLYRSVASDLERVADRVTNIAENALFARVGELTKLNG
jgi:phosphate transport system protein